MYLRFKRLCRSSIKESSGGQSKLSDYITETRSPTVEAVMRSAELEEEEDLDTIIEPNDILDLPPV